MSYQGWGLSPGFDNSYSHKSYSHKGIGGGGVGDP